MKLELYTACLLIPILCCAAADAQHGLDAGLFSSLQPGTGHPPGWRPLTFDDVSNHSVYELVENGGVTVVRATSDNAASGLVSELSVDLNQYPVLQWRWKVNRLIEKGDATRREGDDYPARLYITFDYDIERLPWLLRLKYDFYRAVYGEYPPLAVLNYIWDGKLPVDTLLPNAYTDRVQMIVVQSGSARLGEWVSQERNLYRDYQRAFGEPPPAVSGIAIMTDTDNTGERALSYYGDIRFVQQASGANTAPGEE